MKKEETVDHPIKTLWHAISRAYNQKAAESGMTASIGYVLLNISKKGTPATKIAPLMGLEARSLTRLLKSMEEKKLLYKQQDPKDKRLVRIFLTNEGKELREQARNTVVTFNQVVQKSIPKEKLQVFFEVISDIQKLVDENKIFNT
ncbi:MarR family winged helix-turn-helix transcriptional regulator [Xanthovirga aplysinae]|uniref:MarR family winged helix-turn-helix transcriptional regulator n=1 Tax=Xanthovirga aplysinae TaxID=2529853 RepID=UPI0012BC7957|nr:MarR family transcriptional regulator [Xanthovirga aplysinae]MTI32288.1 MarR family transcriptional regulator [Xanthovirga aplysinae]